MKCFIKHILAFQLAVLTVNGWSQDIETEAFNLSYSEANQLISHSIDSLRILIVRMNAIEDLDEMQKARIDIIRLKTQILEDMIQIKPPFGILPCDTSVRMTSMLSIAQKLIVKSRPDEGIPLIMKYLAMDDHPADSAVYARILLAEAYRQKQEYTKGIDMIYEIIGTRDISMKNRAFAMNRLAALYNEIPGIEGNKTDSAILYSRLCSSISESQGFTEYLAASQNELGSCYWKIQNFDSALHYFSSGRDNFLRIRQIPQAINTYINLARVYVSMKLPVKAKEILINTLDLGDVEKDRNLYMYIYDYLGNVSYELGEYKNACEYGKLSRLLKNQFFNDRIRRQINEMSAKYELDLKEARIREEKGKMKSYRLQRNYLVVIALITTMLLFIFIIWFRFKKRTYTRLVQQNLKSMELEKEAEQRLIRLTDDEIRDQAAASDKPYSELALKFEKFLAEERPYLSAEVSLEEFCKKLNTNRTYLSKLINDRYHVGFYDLLFDYRIKAALQYLNDPAYHHLSVEGIGSMVGFKSNSNFHRRFKSKIGMTPNQFRERALKSRPEA
ncbi:MAG TPA: helix-turn-helix transcriptional regulator [Bacteroidales bacterium]|nr:helix-turn-helix transcriptional regulator [Bacteroidales bacterium]HSA42802.1 helix-turn-helix transcriptional regulator [Bacteroidales bacterium]